MFKIQTVIHPHDIYYLLGDEENFYRFSPTKFTVMRKEDQIPFAFRIGYQKEWVNKKSNVWQHILGAIFIYKENDELKIEIKDYEHISKFPPNIRFKEIFDELFIQFLELIIEDAKNDNYNSDVFLSNPYGIVLKFAEYIESGQHGMESTQEG